MSIDLPPIPPSSADPVNFDPRADAWNAWIVLATGQINAALGLLTSSNNQRIVDFVVDSNINLASGLAAGNVYDGVTLVTGMRALVGNQTTGSQNGVYDVPASGPASRSIDCNSSALFPSGLLIAVSRGTVYAKEQFLHTTAPGFVLNTTALTFRVPTKRPTQALYTSGTSYSPKPFQQFVEYELKGGEGGGGGGSSPNGSGFSTSGSNAGATSFNGNTANGGNGGGRSYSDTTPSYTSGNGGICTNGTGATGVTQRKLGRFGDSGSTNATDAFGVPQPRGGDSHGGEGGTFSGTQGTSGGAGAEGETVFGFCSVSYGTAITMAVGANGSGGPSNGGSGTTAGSDGIPGYIKLKEIY